MNNKIKKETKFVTKNYNRVYKFLSFTTLIRARSTFLPSGSKRPFELSKTWAMFCSCLNGQREGICGEVRARESSSNGSRDLWLPDINFLRRRGGSTNSDTRLTLLSIFGGFSDNFDLDAKLLRMDGSQSYSRWRPSKVYALSFLCEVCVASLGFSNSNKWRKWRKLMELPEVRSCFCYFSGKLLAKWGKLW